MVDGRWKIAKFGEERAAGMPFSATCRQQIGVTEAEGSVVIRLRATTARQVDRHYRNLNRPEGPSSSRQFKPKHYRFILLLPIIPSKSRQGGEMI
jgi:hypothetical protein